MRDNYNNKRKPADSKKTNDFIFGIRAVIEAIDAGKEIDRVLIKRGLQGELVLELMDMLKLYKVPYQLVPVERIDRVTRKNHQGVVAYISPITYQQLDYVLPAIYEEGRIPFILILDGITDVRNFGAIARTAECSGVDAIIIPSKGAAQINSDAIKTSAGALHKIPVCRVESLRKTALFLQESGLKLYAATEKSDKNYFETEFTGPVALVMGSEDTGISNDMMKICDELVRIPIIGEIDSLNVSVAAGVLMYEITKQRMTQTS